MKLKNKNIIITGAGSGLGRELSKQLQKDNTLILIDKNEDTLKETVSMIKGQSFDYIMDCSQENSWKNLRLYLESKNITPDVVINNAGRNLLNIGIEKLEVSDFSTIFNNNFYSVFFGSKEFIPDMKMKKNECAIVNICSGLGLFAVEKVAPYITSKFAVNGFSQTLRQELKNTNILVSIVYPGSMPTNISTNGLLAKGLVMNRIIEEMLENYKKNSWTPTEKAARDIINGIKRNNQRILVGLDTKIMDFISRLAPVLYDIIVLREAKKIYY